MPYTPLLGLQMLPRTICEMFEDGGRFPGSDFSDRAIRMLHLKSLWIVTAGLRSNATYS